MVSKPHYLKNKIGTAMYKISQKNIFTMLFKTAIFFLVQALLKKWIRKAANRYKGKKVEIWKL